MHVCLSSGLSGVYNAAQTAKAALRELYPQRQIGIIDSLSASSGYGLLMDKLADLRDGKMAFASLCQWAETHKLEVQHWFFSTDLSYYVKGGRITKAAGWVGTLLSVFPLLNMDEQGRSLPQQKVHGKKQVIREMVQRMVRYAQGGLSYAGKCYISHSACLTEAQAVATEIEATFHQLCGKVEINHIGTAIGSHTGPGTVALFFWGDKRAAEMA